MARITGFKCLFIVIVSLTIALSASTYAAPVVGVCSEMVSRPTQDRVPDNAGSATPRPESIGTSTVNGVIPTSIPPAVASDICFSVTVNSPDSEYLDYISFDLPDDWTINSQGDVAGTGCGDGHTSGVDTGNVVYWQTVGYPPQTGCGDWNNGSYSFCCNVTIPDCTGAPWSIPWNYVGDGWGGTPHSITGTVSLDCGTVTGQQVLLISPDSTATATGLSAARNSSGTPPSKLADISSIINAIYAYPGYIPVVWNNGLGNPTAADMAPYCVVITGNDYLWSSGGLDSTAIGNALADYIDGGGKVIETQFIQSYDSWGFAGRYMTDGYSPFTVSSLDTFASDSMSIVDPTHPVMTGVTSITDNFDQQDPGLRAGATLLATWSGTGYNAVAVNDDVVALNMELFYRADWTGDIPLLLNNALNWLCPSSAACTTVLDQPLSTVSTSTFIAQEFPDLPTYSSYLADDFTNPTPWTIDTITIPGDGWNGFSTLMNATSLNWAIYADNASIPAGYPGDGATTPQWSLSLPPGDASIVLSNGTSGYPSNVEVTLSAPPTIPAGTWWLIFWPVLSLSPDGQYGRQQSDTTNGYMTKFINPGGGFGWGTAWQDWTITTATLQDMAFSICASEFICPTITIDPATLPAGIVGTVYNQTITASGGTAPYTYSVTMGSLPTGLTLNTSTGVLSGTPTAGGTFTFTVTATDNDDCTGTATYTISLDYGWNMSVYDDAGRASVCLNTDTGYFGWTALTGVGAGTYVGRSNVTFVNNCYYFISNLPMSMNMKINLNTNKASGTFIRSPMRERSIAIDSDITDSPACP